MSQPTDKTRPRNFTLRIWRQKNRQATGRLVGYQVRDISPAMSFLEMLDVLNEDLLHKDEDPVAFDHDCREGICGSCDLFINGRAHGPLKGTPTCSLHMRTFADGDTIIIEPWRANAFPINKDLSCDRSAFDRIIQAGGYVSVNTGGAPDGNEIPIPKNVAERAFESATCIGCGAACKNSSAVLFGVLVAKGRIYTLSPLSKRCLIRLCVDTFSEDVMENPSEPRVRRSQRDYSLPFKLAVVGEVGRGELSYKQAQRRYGIQGRTTVLTWCRRYATHFVTFQAAGSTSPGTAPAVDPTPEQRVKQLETALREQKKQYEKQLKDSMDLNLVLRTMLQMVEEDHGIPLPKKSFRRPFAAWGPTKP